jgi:hypothetical protein
MKRTILAVILLLCCAGLVVFIRVRTDGMHKRWADKERAADLSLSRNRHASSVVVFEFLGGGFKPLVADFYWVRATTLKADELFEMRKQRAVRGMPDLLEHVHLARTKQEQFELYELLRNTTFFDPHFEYAYFYGAHLLSFDGQPDLAISLLEYGLEKNPRSGMIPGLLAFIYYYFKGHSYFKQAAEYAALSYKNSGKYSSMAKEVTNLYAAGNEYGMAIEFLKSVLESSTDPATSAEINEQLKYLYVEKHIAELQDLVDRYIARYDGRMPESLDQFVSLGFITDVPEDPFGGKYVLTPQGKVVNQPLKRFAHFQNLRDYIPEKGFNELPQKVKEDHDGHEHVHDENCDHDHDHDHDHEH